MAITYTLNFTIDAAGVAAINGSNQYITITKQIIGSSRATCPVAWLTFPAAQTIQVSWQETYYLYATNQQFEAGATITELAITPQPSLAGYEYTFNAKQIFGSPVSGQPAGSFEVNNQVGSDAWQFGLAQYATIGGDSTPTPIPLNIVPVLNNEVASFTPEETVSIFLQSFSNDGVVITEVSSSALVTTLTSSSPTAHIGFDDSSNTFYNTTNNVTNPTRVRAALRGDGAAARMR